MTFEEGNFYTLNGVIDIARCQSKRIKLLEKRIIDLQGHDDFTSIYRKLIDQEDLKDAVEREWVGLTDDEVEEAFSFPFHYRSFYKAVEAKLKEKNGG
jgi:hypothetical protein